MEIPIMEVSLYFAMIAFCLSFCYNIPQIYKIYKTKNVSSISFSSYFLVIIGHSCSLVRFIDIREYVAMASVIVGIITCGIVLIQYTIYKK